VSRFFSLVAVAFVLSLGALLLFASTRYTYEQPLPIKLGTSGGNLHDRTSSYCCSGTLGALVSRNGTQYILSANHVLARSSQATIGEGISQPGLVDTKCGTTPYHVVANLSQFAKLGGSSNVDAAIAKVRPGAVNTSGAMMTLGVPSRTPIVGAVNMHVAKVGRTTGLTCSNIAATNVSVKVEYSTKCGGGSTFVVLYTNQLLINSSKFSAAGDSGSLILRAGSAQPVGLLYAGSSTATVANRVQDISKAFGGLSFVGGANHAITCPSTTAAAVAPQATAELPPPSAEAMARAEVVRQAHEAALLTDASVQAVGLGASDESVTEPAIVVVVDQARYHGGVPQFLDGVKTRVVRTDPIRAFGWNESRTNQSCALR
jgi:hypothetical protein